jgi:hypothetical protein
VPVAVAVVVVVVVPVIKNEKLGGRPSEATPFAKGGCYFLSSLGFSLLSY